MIEIIDDVIGLVRTVPELGGRVYRVWPKKKLKMPAALVSRIGGNPTFTDADGSEVIANVAYSVDINAEDLATLDSIVEQVADLLSTYNLHRTGLTEFYDDQLQVHRVILTVSGTVDIRGNTFTGGY